MTKLNDAQLAELLSYVSKDSFVYALAIEVKLARQAAPKIKAVLTKIASNACPSSWCSCDRVSAGAALRDNGLTPFLRGELDEDSNTTDQRTSEN